MADPDCTGFAATCSRCACVVRLEEEPDEEDEVFCDACEHEIDLEYERERLDIAKEEIARLRRDLAAAHLVVDELQRRIRMTEIANEHAAISASVHACSLPSDCVSCGHPALGHVVDDEERRECVSCDCKQYVVGL